MTGSRRDDVVGLVVVLLAILAFSAVLGVLVLERRVGGAILTGPVMSLGAVLMAVGRWRRGGR